MSNARSLRGLSEKFKTDHSLPMIIAKKSVSLPRIEPRRKNQQSFYDDIVLSPEYVKISTH
jgi:hypothetical protein